MGRGDNGGDTRADVSRSAIYWYCVTCRYPHADEEPMLSVEARAVAEQHYRDHLKGRISIAETEREPLIIVGTKVTVSDV